MENRQGELGGMSQNDYVSEGNVVRLRRQSEISDGLSPGPLADSDTPLISVVTANYNGARFLSQTIKSVLNQSHANLEYIIVDDGSSDDSIAIIKHWSQLDQRIKPIYLPNNGGVAKARNLGIENTSGDYITFIDADDLWEPLKLEKQLGLFQLHPDAGIVVTGALTIDDEGNRLRPRKQAKEVHDGPVNVFDYIAGKFPVSINAMTLRECLEKVGGFNPNYLIGEDYELWMRISKYYEYYHIDEPLHQYRLHSSNATRRDRLVNRECKVRILEDAIVYNPELSKAMTPDIRIIIQRKYNSLGKAYFYKRQFGKARASFDKALAMKGSRAQNLKSRLWKLVLLFAPA